MIAGWINPPPPNHLAIAVRVQSEWDCAVVLMQRSLAVSDSKPASTPRSAGFLPVTARGGGNAQVPPGARVRRIKFDRSTIAVRRLLPPTLDLEHEPEVKPRDGPVRRGLYCTAKRAFGVRVSPLIGEFIGQLIQRFGVGCHAAICARHRQAGHSHAAPRRRGAVCQLAACAILYCWEACSQLATVVTTASPRAAAPLPDSRSN
jgi:hypothetical protein